MTPTRPQPSASSTEPEASRAVAPRTRFVTAAALFDGHDAAINVMRRILQSSGAEVIHLGHNRSAQDIVTAALQEDASAIAVSSYQGGHMEFFKYIIKLLADAGAPRVHVFGGGGGTITASEATELENSGVTKIYSPEDGRKLGLQGIIGDMIQRAFVHPLNRIQWDRLETFPTNALALAQALTCIELGEIEFQGSYAPHKKDLNRILELSQNAATKTKATVIGLTGTGGAGKSSLTDELVLRLVDRFPEARVAILAIDPTRKKTGGALLGDRMRINSLKNSRVFMRSFATRESNVSVSQATKSAVALFKSAGFDWIFVETGGIGQADTSIVGLADLNIYVMTSEFGAPTQLEKINMLDYADMVVINKIDKTGALDALNEVRKQYRRNHTEWLQTDLNRLPVFGTIASKVLDRGVNEAFEHLVKIKDANPKRQLTGAPHTSDEAGNFAIVPRERVSYLSEISSSVHEYRRETLIFANLAQDLDGLGTMIKKGELSAATRQELEQLYQKKKEALDPKLVQALNEFPQIQKKYAADHLVFHVRNREIKVPLFHESLSHNKIPKIATPHFLSKSDLVRFIRLENLPGYFPFTAGVYPLKRTEEDPKRQFAGEGTPTQTNKRFHLLCKGEKAKRLSTAFDSVTLYGEDPDERPDIYGKIGESGVSICTLDDMRKLYTGFELTAPSTSVSMTINGPAPMLLAFFFNTAIDQEADRFSKENKRPPNSDEYQKIKAATLSAVRGTVQADILKEDQAQNTCIFSTEFALRMMGDIQDYFIQNHIKNFYSVSISGYHIAEAGANPISQLAFTLANGFTYVEYYRARGMAVSDFAPNFSFFFSNALDAEYTVIGRVARRIWAIAMRDVYKADERSQKLKYHIQTSGRSLHAQEISFNDIRTTLQALLAYFDQCNSLHTNAYDEAVTTPTEESVRRAMAIQLIIAKEFGWAKSENPHQGSFFVEQLTDLVEEAVLAEFDRISTRGGVLGAMETHYQRSKIQEESLYYEHLKHSGELPLIGVNTYLNPSGVSAPEISANQLTRASYTEKDEQIRNLRAFQEAHATESEPALLRLKDEAKAGKNLFAALMEAARVCSLGQMSRALYEVGGQYRRNM